MKRAGEIKALFDAFIQKLPSREELEEARRTRQRGPLGDPLVIRGTLVLEGQFAAEYTQLVEEAHRIAGNDGTWSRSAVDDLLAECTIEVLYDPKDARSKTARTQGRRILDSLKSPLSDWIVELQVGGCTHDMAGARFGEVDFVVDRIRKDLLVASVVGGLGEFITVTLARTRVTAIDRNSAEWAAGRKVDEHLAVINALCSDGIPSLIHLHRGEDNIGTRISLRRTRKSPDTEFSHGSHTDLTGRLLSRAEFNESLRNRGGQRVGDFMTRRTEFAERLVAAYVTAGSASVEEKPFLAFLLYAVALESAILGDQSKTEITFQLSARVAHLLGGTLPARESLAKRMKRLYSLRSTIAHSGSREISKADLSEMRIMCLFGLNALTVSPEFANAKTASDLDSWFHRKLLGG